MDEDESHHFLSFEYKGSEYTPDRMRRYLSFRVRANHGFFAGETEFETTAEALQHFVGELNEFYDLFSNSPNFIAGWGEDIYFSLTLSKHGRLGDVALDCEIKSRSIGTHFDSVHIYSLIKLGQVIEIPRFFQRVLTSEDPETFHI